MLSFVEVQPSNIKNAGNGLFATQDIPVNSIVCYYSGYIFNYVDGKFNN
jgi:hypothetical protein